MRAALTVFVTAALLETVPADRHHERIPWSGAFPFALAEDYGPSLLQTRALLKTRPNAKPSDAASPWWRPPRRSASTCVKDFQECWDLEKGYWAGDAACRSSFVSCRGSLCKEWLPQKCGEPGHDCEAMATMCQATAATDASGKALDVDHPLVFLHLPKNAGTAVEEAGNQGNVEWGRYRTWGAVQMPDGYWCNKYHVPPVLLPDPEIYFNSEVFCVVRHPFDRAVSEYKYLLSMPWGDTYMQLPDQDRQCHGRGLNKYLREVMHAVTAGYTYINDCHMIKQSTYIWSHGRQWCQDIIHMENLETQFSEIMNRVGYNVALKEEANAATACENLSAKDLDETTKHMLRAYYKDDFVLLNYSMDL